MKLGKKRTCTSPVEERLSALECWAEKVNTAITHLTSQGDATMGTLAELQTTITAEKGQVQAMLAALAREIEDLKNQPGVVTSEQFDALIASVRGISQAE